MRTEFLALMFACVMASGCSGDLYSATSTKDGVFILNKLTGTVRQVDGNILVELPDGHVPPPLPPHKPLFGLQRIPKQPFVITGVSKYRGEMLLKLSISPNAVLKTPDEWGPWREQLSAVRGTGSLHLEFLDADGFTVAARDVALLPLRESVNEEGELIGIDDQVRIAMTADEFNQVTGWQLGWSGFFKDFKPATR